MIDGERIIHEVRYSHPLQTVWDAVTDPAALAAWLMPTDFVPRVGHRFRLDARPAFGVIDGEVVDLEPPYLLRCRWRIDGRETTVTIRLRADGADTVLRLEHDGLPRRPRAGFDLGWADKLDHDLILVLRGARDPGRSRVEHGVHRNPALEAPP